MKICQNCKLEKLKQINVAMKIGIGYCKIGKCDICENHCEELFSYSEINKKETKNENKN